MNQNDFRHLLATAKRQSADSTANANASQQQDATTSGGRKGAKKKGGAPRKAAASDDQESEGSKPKLLGDKYRDRAKERREQKTASGADDGNETQNEPEITEEQMANIDYEKSKYLGGDEQHTHLVKGLDFKLAERIRQKQQEQQKQKQSSSNQANEHRQRINREMQEATGLTRANMPSTFHSHLASAIHRLIQNDTLTGAHRTSTGLGITNTPRSAQDRFLPGRTAFEFDIGDDPDDLEAVCRLPTLITRPKEDIAEIDDSMSVRCPQAVIERLSEILNPSTKEGKRGQYRTKLFDDASKIADTSKDSRNESRTKQNPHMEVNRVIDEDEDIFDDAGSYFESNDQASDEKKEEEEEEEDVLSDSNFDFFDTDKQNAPESLESTKDTEKKQASSDKGATTTKDQAKLLQQKTQHAEYDEFLPTIGDNNLSTVVQDSDEEGDDPFEIAKRSKQELQSALEMAGEEHGKKTKAKGKRKRKEDPKLEELKEKARKKNKFEKELKDVETLVEEKRKKKQEKEDN